MADQTQVERLKRSVEEWNQWRIDNPDEKIDLRQAELAYANLEQANLGKANLCEADLSHANLNSANLTEAELSQTFLNHATLIAANLRAADLNSANLFNTTLRAADFSHADLTETNLSHANLLKAILNDANLSQANLYRANALDAALNHAVLTGACIADWQISSSTSFNGIRCDYIFRSYDYAQYAQKAFTDRLPVDPNSTFKPGEFEQWIAVRQGALDTIDITFTDGIDWQAFFQSLQTVRQQHPDAAVRMQGVQEVNGSYVASLQLETEIVGAALEQLKATIENEVKASYTLQLAEAQGEIKALERSLNRSERSLDKAVEKLATTSNQIFYGPVGNVTSTHWGNMTATINNNNYGDKADDIIQLLTSLRESAQFFPEEQRAMAELQVEDLTNDVAQPQPNPVRLRTRLMALLGIAIALGTVLST